MDQYESGRPSVMPDERAVDYLIEEVAGGLSVTLGFPPEGELDATLVGCELLLHHPNPAGVIPDDILEIESWDQSGVAVVSDVWSEFSRDVYSDRVKIIASVCGIRSWLFCWDPGGDRFDLECVYKNHAQDASDTDIGSRIWRWCSAVVTLGDSLMASRVEVPGQRGPEPIVLWRRQTDGER